MTKGETKARKPGRPRRRDAVEHRRLGDDLARQGKFTEAEKAYREALRVVPDDVGALEGLAAVLEKQGSDPEALEYQERLVLLERWPLWDDGTRRSLEGPD